MVALDDVRRLAADLDRFLTQLLEQVQPDHLTSAEGDGPRVPHARSTRRQQLERYINAMSIAQRLRLAAAPHLLSARLDEDLADPRPAGRDARGLTPPDYPPPHLSTRARQRASTEP
jgi:hypothetical protein